MEERGFEVGLELQEGFRFEADFGVDGVERIVTDEPPPLGEGSGPNPARLLGTAVGSCMASSLLFCMRKARVEVAGMRVRVEGSMARNEAGRLRVSELRVRLAPELGAGDPARALRCLELFEDYCIVGQSVRAGIDVAVQVEPTAALEPA